MKNAPKLMNIGPWKKITATSLPKEGYVVPIVLQCPCGCKAQDVQFAFHDRERGWAYESGRYLDEDIYPWTPTHFAKQVLFIKPKPVKLEKPSNRPVH